MKLYQEIERWERDEFDRCCPYWCNGSKKGVGKYIAGASIRFGLSLERVSYAFRTTHTVAEFVCALLHEQSASDWPHPAAVR